VERGRRKRAENVHARNLGVFKKKFPPSCETIGREVLPRIFAMASETTISTRTSYQRNVKAAEQFSGSESEVEDPEAGPESDDDLDARGKDAVELELEKLVFGDRETFRQGLKDFGVGEGGESEISEGDDEDKDHELAERADADVSYELKAASSPCLLTCSAIRYFSTIRAQKMQPRSKSYLRKKRKTSSIPATNVISQRGKTLTTRGSWYHYPLFLDCGSLEGLRQKTLSPVKSMLSGYECSLSD
jgi:hypothetical protein